MLQQCSCERSFCNLQKIQTPGRSVTIYLSPCGQSERTGTSHRLQITIPLSAAPLQILDFGLARSTDAEMTGYVVTRWYRAPEVILNWMHYTQTGKTIVAIPHSQCQWTRQCCDCLCLQWCVSSQTPLLWLFLFQFVCYIIVGRCTKHIWNCMGVLEINLSFFNLWAADRVWQQPDSAAAHWQVCLWLETRIYVSLGDGCVSFSSLLLQKATLVTLCVVLLARNSTLVSCRPRE